MAKRRVARRGRVQVAIGLAVFVVVMTGVVWRRTVGYARAVAMRLLEGQVKELEAERAKLITDIRSAMSIGRLGPVVQARLGMRQASDSQTIRLPMPAPRAKD
ncbi:MAG TPA: hypothetical protein PKC83_07545 [Gemmatimonadaceae bacterium]|nr:hypothetical protein [Gemmatimonadaceae bacterium]